MPSTEKNSLRKGFDRARDVHPVGITGKESPAEIIERMFPAYVGRQERTAFELMRRSSQEDVCTFLTMSGAMTPAEFLATKVVRKTPSKPKCACAAAPEAQDD